MIPHLSNPRAESQTDAEAPENKFPWGAVTFTHLTAAGLTVAQITLLSSIVMQTSKPSYDTWQSLHIQDWQDKTHFDATEAIDSLKALHVIDVRERSASRNDLRHIRVNRDALRALLIPETEDARHTVELAMTLPTIGELTAPSWHSPLRQISA